MKPGVEYSIPFFLCLGQSFMKLVGMHVFSFYKAEGGFRRFIKD
jgi:hypothetical protein